MNPLITNLRLNIYRRYKGDVDGIPRVGTAGEIKAFGPDLGIAWSAISSKLQDIELIKAGLVSEDYKSKIISELKLICDAESFNKLTGGLSL